MEGWETSFLARGIVFFSVKFGLCLEGNRMNIAVSITSLFLEEPPLALARDFPLGTTKMTPSLLRKAG